MLGCLVRGPVLLYAIFDAGQNTDEVMKWPSNWLFLDGKRTLINDRRPKRTVANGWINLFFPLDNVLLAKIATAKSVVGVGLSPAPGSAIFSGFAQMPFADGASKLTEFLQVCRRH